MTSSGQKESASYKIFVGGLDPSTSEEDLTEYFSKFGRVVERLIKVDIKTKRSRGFAFIGFKNPEAVDKVLEIDEHYLQGKKIDCKRAMTKEDAYSLNKNLKESCRKVYISNIPRELSKKDLYDLFSEYGKINDFNLIFKKKETGFLYIIYETEEEALNLIEKKIVEINGCRLEVQRAIPKDVKESPDDEPKAKAMNSYQQTQVFKYRNSFESPFSYENLYTSTATPLAMGGQHPKHSHYNYYEAVGPSPHRMAESLSPYERPVMVQHAHVMPGADTRYHPGRIYPPQPTAYPSNVDQLGMERLPHRSRVRSEQAINTITPLFMTPPAQMHHPVPEMRPVPTRSRMGGHSFSHVDDNGYQLLYNTLHEQEKQPGSARDSGPQRPRAAAHEFIENKMDFSSIRPKESPSKQEPTSAQLKKEASPSKNDQNPNSRQLKQARIKALEEEIKARKEKLKALEDRLKAEYATVEEGLSNHEGQSHSSNYE